MAFDVFFDIFVLTRRRSRQDDIKDKIDELTWGYEGCVESGRVGREKDPDVP